MTSVCTPIDEIDRLWFSKIPRGRPIQVDRMVCVDGVTLIVGKNGKLYATGKRFADNVAYAVGVYPWTNGLIRALYKLKVISHKAMQDHLALCKKHSEASSKRYAQDRLLSGAAALGIKLTAAQKRKAGIKE